MSSRWANGGARLIAEVAPEPHTGVMTARPEIPEDLLIKHHPIAVFADRYGGIYSSGRWLAVASADEPYHGETRASWVLGHGPFGDDIEARDFWVDPPSWIASGDTPEDAISRLEKGRGEA